MEHHPGSSTQGAKNCHVWSAEEDAQLVACLLVLRDEGKYWGEGTFKPGHLVQLESMLEQKLPGCGIKAMPHIQSRMKTLKANWQIVYDMVFGANTSGFGWDPDRNCVTADQAVWDEYLKSHKTAAPFKRKSFPHFDDLCIVWAKDRATGRHAEAARDIVEEVDGTGIGESPIDLDDTPHGSPVEHRQGVPNDTHGNFGDVGGPSRKRKRCQQGGDESVVETIKNFDVSLKVVAEKFCEKISQDDAMGARSIDLVGELLLVDGLTPDEVCKAHIEISRNDRLLMSFPHIPAALKATWIRQLIG